ncbi:MAG: glutaminyl-peptide cyclotransferase [Bdellovibrionaceae bacterium]|nr:glutaminyl-peptide cyclotransferase [Pseudobdellovibrionaceae bacterium]
MIALNAVFLILVNGASAAPACPAPEYIDFQVESVVARNPVGFTQGLEIHDGAFYESTGAYKDTTKINRISMDGKVETLVDHGEKKEAGQQIFGEGMTILNGKIYQLTYKNKVAYVYDMNGKLLKTMPSPLKEGWGLANDGKRLISSDGSHQLSFHDPENLEKSTKVAVRDENGPVTGLNELEFVNGKVYANIFGSNEIVRINPETGCVEARADMTNLVKQIPKPHGNPLAADRNFVLNGIAFDKDNDKFYLTGKNWPVLFKTRMVKSSAPKPPSLPGLPGLQQLRPGSPGTGCNPSQGPCGAPTQK